jgi:hypothetical protein
MLINKLRSQEERCAIDRAEEATSVAISSEHLGGGYDCHPFIPEEPRPVKARHDTRQAPFRPPHHRY